MKSVPRHGVRGWLLVALIAVFFFVSARPALSQTIDYDFRNVYADISWDEVAKYIVATPESTRQWADLIQRYPDRFLFGTDSAAPTDQSKYSKVFYQYDPLWKALDPETSRKVRLRNYERLFDEARHSVRAWESTHIPAIP